MTLKLLKQRWLDRVVLSYGMGVDSTAILLRWLKDPTSRNFDLKDLLVITAMTGDEFASTGTLVTDYILPLLREHGVRFVQESLFWTTARALRRSTSKETSSSPMRCSER
jgi:hypothetical protein